MNQETYSMANITALRKLTGAAQGAQEGAKTGGSMAGGWGALIGGILGAGAGAITTEGETWDEKQRKARLERLLRLEELGALGLSPAEKAELEQELINPKRAQMREAQQRTLQAMGSQDSGAGAVFRDIQAENAQEAESLMQERMLIQRADSQREKEQKQIISRLSGEREDIESQAKKDLGIALTGFQDVADMVGGKQAEGEDTKQQEENIAKTFNAKDYKSFLELLSFLKTFDQ